jgi:uncharacterized protein
MGRNIICICLLLVFNTVRAQKNEPLKKCNLIIVNRDKRRIQVAAEIADTQHTRTYGLMNRKSLAKNSGMLFVFNTEKYLSFWMKNTYIPLSIAYIDKKGVIRDIQHMKPLDTSVTYPSKYPVKYALEVNRGWFKKNNIKPGCIVYLNGCLRK